MHDGLGFTALTVPYHTADRVKCIELNLIAMQIVQKIRRQGLQWLGGFPQHWSPVLGAVAKTRAVPRLPKPAARHAMTRTMRSGDARWPCKMVPLVSYKEPWHETHGSWRHAWPPGWPVAQIWPRPRQP
jgi:hypothetical protein